ncbi:MAG: pilus assembly protein FimV, partial [Burkholderiaceae bacterium]|nr:pilus assembly protein FimV [Burkholderiaceae bacterium]
RLVREYTFLLDPPELRVAGRNVVDGGNTQASVVPAAAAPAAAPVQVAQAQAAPAQAAPAAAPPAPAVASQQQAAPAPAPVRAAAQAPADTARASGSGGRAPVLVKPGDTLAGIAGALKPGGVSLDQTMVALYQANPAAFFGGVNRMLAGKTLAVPDAQTMSAVDAAKASELVRAHTRDFAAYRARLAETARSVSGSRGGQTAAGTVSGRVDDRAAPAAGDKLALSRTDGGVAASTAGGTGTTATRSSAAEQGVARDAALRESQSRVAELEKNVGDLQKLLELKNRQLADLQRQVESAGAAVKAATGTIAKADPATAAPAAAAPAPAPAPAAAASPTGDTASAVAPKTGAAPPAPKAEAPKSAPAPAPASQPGFLGDLADNPLVLPGLGAILALGAGYGWYAMRRRRKVEKFEDSLIAGEGFATNSLFGSTGGQSVDTASSVFASSAKDSGVDVHSTEVDPIAEAEVYIAYGREAQAEEILREALKKQPERQAIRAKLLEIYSGRKDVGAYNGVAAEMHAMTGGQNEEWPKVVTMGLALDPENALYTGRAPVADVGTTDSAADDSLDDAFLADDGAAPGEADAPREVVAHVAAPAQDESPAVDFGLLETPAGFSDTRPLADSDLIGKSDADDEVPALDFDLEIDTTIGKAGERIASTRGSDSDGRTELERSLDSGFDLPSLDLGTPSTASAPADDDAEQAVEDLPADLPLIEGLQSSATSRSAVPSALAGSAAHEMDLSSIGLDLAPAAAEAGSVDGLKWQEMATKLDLASAYEEIGDKEGARELLDEVVKGGDGEQQSKARAMLAKLD